MVVRGTRVGACVRACVRAYGCLSLANMPHAKARETATRRPSPPPLDRVLFAAVQQLAARLPGMVRVFVFHRQLIALLVGALGVVEGALNYISNLLLWCWML